MSEKIYKQARKYCDKFLRLHKVLSGVHEKIKKNSWRNSPFSTNRYMVNLDNNKTGIVMKMARGKYNSYEVHYHLAPYTHRDSQRRNNFYVITDHTKFIHCSTKTVQDLRDISVYDECLAFQLSTVYTDSELFDYYCCSMLHTAGFRGACRTNVHHSTWKALYLQALSIGG
ncbi:hypothetical protein pEaSNUABM12_00047 [Erwinia phage pEa_SNUABM_12]|uniref:Uncharacterized protein n=1 Tax=Erwinia phage pEa_SNUABM_12 TaxID=2768773 RepID=A0A7L8ZKP3_9CAUD|nr:hypothetical protein pEaSNUABM12_00047 [Erwinia phage pEa_SNUABM_12]